MRNIYITIISILLAINSYGQTNPKPSVNRRATTFLNNRLKIKDYKIEKMDYTPFEIKDSLTSFLSGKVDTISIDKITIDLRASILGDTILYSKSNEKRSLEEDNQNCISYAFENLFKTNGIDAAPLFGAFTLVIDNNSTELLLKRFCDLYDSCGTKLPNTLQNKSLIACYDKNEDCIHMIFYYDNLFYSKNGGGTLHTVYQHFKDILLHYPKIEHIKLFKIKGSFQRI